MLHGVFIGIDRYSAPVSRLSCARADAEALAALFEDTLGGNVMRLLDAEATLVGIRDQLRELESVDEGDFVFISFSGHGTPDHHLVPVDVDVADVTRTCLSLVELAQLLDRIPARRLVVALDCCFSGGFGDARVFAPHLTRNLTEDRSTLQTLVRGEGRIVIAASGAGEPALETQEFGHGLLSFHLMQGLQGTEDLIENKAIPILRLFDYVSTRVMDSAALLGEQQTPSIYGSLDGAPAISPLAPGAAYAAAFPDRVTAPIDATWESLAPYGIPDEILQVWAAQMPQGPNALQQDAVNQHRVLTGRSLLVVAPTGSGKTMIGELAAVKHAVKGARAVMLLPLKALVNDKHEYFNRAYGDQFKVIRATGDYGDEIADLYAGQYDLALLTYEKFLSLVIGTPFLMRGISLVVVDEAQNISDPGRGAALEFLLTLVRSGHARGGAPQIIALSAVIGSTNGLERWLGAELLSSDKRPIPLRESIVDAYGNARHWLPDGSDENERGFVQREYVAGSQGNKPIVIPLVRRLVSEGKKVIVFRSTKGDVTGAAGYLARALGLPPAQDVLDRLPIGDPSASSEALREVLARGVGFHTADLDREERAAIEQVFRDPSANLQVVVATTTLAMGINTPAEAVVIAGLRHPFAGPYLVSEYKNMVGRAGRPGFTQQGESYIVASDSPTPAEAWNRYVHGEPEEIVSHFLSAQTDPQTLVLRSLAALGSSVDEQELVDLLDNSYAIWSLKDQGRLEGWDIGRLQRDIDALITAGLLDREPNGVLTLTELGRYAGESGIEVRSVTRVASALRFVPDNVRAPDLVALAQVTLEMDDMYIPIHKRSNQEQARWPQTLVNLGASVSLVRNLHVGGGETLPRSKRAVACLYYMSSSRLSAIEAELTRHMRDSAIAGPVRSVAARTRDFMGPVTRIVELSGKAIDPSVTLDGLSIQLEFGLPPECVALAAKLGNLLTRGEYLQLLDRGAISAEAVLGLRDEELDELVGSERAAVLRDQLSRDT